MLDLALSAALRENALFHPIERGLAYSPSLYGSTRRLSIDHSIDILRF